MALMASSLPDTSMLDVKLAQPGFDKEHKVDVNGFAPPTESAIESKPAPLVNGSSKRDEHEPTGGMSPPEGLQEAEISEAFTSNQQLPLATEPNLDQSSAEEPGTAQSPPPKAPEDIEMADMPSTDDKHEEPAPNLSAGDVKPEEAPVSEAWESRSSEDKVDVEMSRDEPSAPSAAKVEESPVDAPASPAQAALADEPTAPPAREVDLQQASVSQLAIDSTEAESFSEPTAEVPMADAADAPHPTSTKIAREREDDSVDEPAAKRARTESQDPGAKEGEVTVTETMDTVVAGDSAPKEPPTLGQLPGWVDPDNDDKPFTTHQVKEYRKVVAGIKKTKAGAGFKDSVQNLWPALWNTYVEKIEKPIDLGEIDRSIRDGTITTLRHFKDALTLLYQNSVTFNGTEHEVTRAAWSTVEQIWTRASPIPTEEPTKTKPAPKQMPTRHAEPRAAAQPPPRRQSTSVAAPPAAEKTPPEQTYAVPPGGVPQIRRASTQHDGDRPKRAIHPPKNKDLDYTPKSINKKKLQPDLRFCSEVLDELMDEKHAEINGPFLVPVDAVALGIPTYFNIIKKPMDLGTIKEKLATGQYASSKDFKKDVLLIFSNCAKFNSPGQLVYGLGKNLEALFKELWGKKDEWLAKNAPSQSGRENSRSDVDGDSDEEEEDAAPAEEVTSSNDIVKELEERLTEETTKLNQLYLDANPNQVLISVQQQVVASIQQGLLSEKQKLAATTKPEKPAKAKAAPKASKPKASGGNKKASGGAATKKAGGAGGGGGSKKSTKKSLTSQEKDLVANAINDLESPYIERAIDLIKKDTGQAENDSGELELDIDQLSNACLVKLYELCKQVLPNFASSLPTVDNSPALSSAPAAKSTPAKSTAKPKKNKPMSAREQEQRIAELKKVRESFKDASQELAPAVTPPPGAQLTGAESSEDSDSEEE